MGLKGTTRERTWRTDIPSLGRLPPPSPLSGLAELPHANWSPEDHLRGPCESRLEPRKPHGKSVGEISTGSTSLPSYVQEQRQMAINLAGPGKPTKARPALHSLCQEGRVGCIKGVWRPRSLPCYRNLAVQQRKVLIADSLIAVLARMSNPSLDRLCLGDSSRACPAGPKLLLSSFKT